MQLETPLDELLETGAHVRVLRALVGLPQGFAASTRDIARREGWRTPQRRAPSGDSPSSASSTSGDSRGRISTS